MISLRCTVLDATDPCSATDLEVRAPVGSTLAQVQADLLGASAVDQRHTLTAGGQPLAPHTPLGERPLVDGALIVACSQPRSLVAQSQTMLALHVVAGPDAGQTLPLRPGSFTVGRGTTADLAVDDADLSRQHFAVTVGPDGVHVSDLDSTNGTLLQADANGASTLDERPEPWRPGHRLRAGRSAFVVRTQSTPAAATLPNGRGQIDVHRSPRMRTPIPVVEIAWPTPPSQSPAHRVPWLTALLPLLLCVPLAWWMHQPSYLLFGLMSPVMMLGGALTDRVQRRRRSKTEACERRDRETQARSRLARALAGELAALRDLAGDPAELLQTARVPGARLWERMDDDPQLLEVIVGSGRRRATVSLTGAVTTELGDPAGDPWLADAPIPVAFEDVGHLGVVGDPALRAACARHLIGQLAVRVSPRHLRLVAIGGATWRWMRWLPHSQHMDAADLAALVHTRLHEPRSNEHTARSPRIVILVDGEWLHHNEHRLDAVLADGPQCGVHLLWLHAAASALPAQCSAVLDVAEHGCAHLRAADGSTTTVAADGTSAAWAELVARALAPLRDTSSDGSAMPREVGLGDLLRADLGPEATTSASIVHRWRAQPRSTRFIVGLDAQGATALDLAQDGPHALVAGTTGAGKSEFLATLVAALAVVNRPDELCFVLIDYKGGAAFRQCTLLPHVVGVVTDLDEHLAARALSSLQAELTRRERLLADAGAADLDGYQRARHGDPALPRLARLVIVVDEFRLLATELPDLLDGMIRLAAVGRSLGVHLVLATQRPGGIVSADIKANVNLRVCLRVRDRIDSDDVIEAPDAASLPQDAPGRAFARAGATALRQFQVALAGGLPSRANATTIAVRRLAANPAPTDPARSVGGQPENERNVEHAPDEMAELAAQLHQASQRIGAIPPPSPWLPSLPDLVEARQLNASPGSTSSLEIGLIDLPDRGEQAPFHWDPHHGSHLAISGTARTGRTTTLCMLALALAASHAAGALNAEVHVIDAAGGRLGRLLTGLPFVGTVTTADQPRLVARLVARLTESLASRGDGDPERTILMIDGWDRIATALEQVDHGVPLDDLLALLRDGESAGLRLLVAGGRGVLLSRISHVVGERVLLRPADPTDLLLAGVGTKALPHWPPGRAVHASSGRELQVAWPGDDAQLTGRLAALGAAMTHQARLRLCELPAMVTLAQVSARATGLAEHTAVLIGLGGDAASPVHLDLRESSLIAVAGPSGSGRTTALHSICQQLSAAARPVVVVASHAGSWPCPTVSPTALAQLRTRICEQPTTVVVLDDADLVQRTQIEALLVELASIGTVVVGTTIDHLASSFTGLADGVRRHRTGLLLQPSRAGDGAPFGIRAEPSDAVIPGRGMLIDRGNQVAVQVAVPDETP